MHPREFKKTYLSRAMTRALSLDAPIGDPFGGPAYEERNDPVSAAVTFFEAATAFETIAAIGAVVGVVGMVTGNSDLTKIGGVMGLVGGFGTMAQSGLFGTGAGSMQEWAQGVNQSFGTSTARNISSAASVVDPGATMVDGMSASQVVDMQGGAAQAGLIEGGTELNLAQAASAADTSGMLAPGLDAPAGGLINEPTMIAADGTAAGAQNLANTPVAASNPALNIAAAGEPANAMSAAAQQGGNLDAIAKAAGKGIDTGPSLFDKILTFGKENKEISQAALTGIAGMYQSSEKAAALEAQARANNSTAGLYDARIAEMQTQQNNANAIPGVQGFSVNRNAPIYNKTPVTAAGVRPAGFIQTRSA